jgi:hypothetical protein
MDILVMRQGKLLYYNIFKCRGQSRALYTILRVLKDFGYDARVELLGDISTEDELFRQLNQYLPDLNFATVQDTYELNFDKDFDIHRFVNLFYISE